MRAALPLLVAAIAALVLSAATRATFAWVVPPTAYINIRWSAHVGGEARASHERALGLEDGRSLGERTWAYTLPSPTIARVRSIVEHPDVEDTHHVDRSSYRVEASALVPADFDAARSGLPGVVRGVAMTFRAIAGGCAAVGGLRLLAPGAAAISLGLGVALAIVWGRYVAALRMMAANADGWSVGDWLTGYGQGFARRGLPGSPLLWLSEAAGVAPEWVVFGLLAVLYALFLSTLFLLLRRKQLNVWFVAMLFSPAALLFPVHTVDAIGRKEVLFLAGLALYAWRLPRPTARHAVLWGLFGVAATLSHELVLFFTPYFLVARALSGETRPQGFQVELALLGGSAMAFVLAATLGADLRADAQCAALLQKGYQDSLCGGVLRYPVQTLSSAIDDTLATAVANDYGSRYSSAAVLSGMSFAAFWAFGGARPLPRVAPAVALALAWSAPLFVAAIDWGRWINVHVLALTIVLGRWALRNQSLSPGTQGASVFLGARTAWAQVLIVIAVGWYLTGWTMGQCCTRAFTVRWLPY